MTSAKGVAPVGCCRKSASLAVDLAGEDLNSAHPTTPAPDQILSVGDPGDDVGSRFRFQYTWAASVSCALFDDTQDIVEVFCEHHEDILIKHRDGHFTGQQVKTRESDQPVWKSGDKQVVSACSRFVQLEGDFPGHFRAFRFLTGHPLHVANNAQALGFVLKAIADAPTLTDLPRAVLTWLRRIAKLAGSSEAIAFAALKKTTASSDLPKLVDATMRLIHTLTNCWSDAKECTHEAVVRAANSLVDECAKAASLDHAQIVPAYILATHQPVAEIEARINGKKMTADRAREILAASLVSTAPLTGDPARAVEPGTGDSALMLKKLDAGGFSAVGRNSAEDLRDKADYLAIGWTKKNGKRKGLEQYDHVRSIALADAARAFDATKTDVGKFGPQMRDDLQRRFQRRLADGVQLYDCSVEHLEGMAYSLTSQCKVQWSIDRPWEKP